MLPRILSPDGLRIRVRASARTKSTIDLTGFMETDLVHSDKDGNLAVVAVMLRGGSGEPGVGNRLGNGAGKGGAHARAPRRRHRGVVLATP
jgi:hypothetical protein